MLVYIYFKYNIETPRSGGERINALLIPAYVVGALGPAGPNNSRSLILLREHRPSPFRAPSGVEGASNGQKCLEVQI